MPWEVRPLVSCSVTHAALLLAGAGLYVPGRTLAQEDAPLWGKTRERATGLPPQPPTEFLPLSSKGTIWALKLVFEENNNSNNKKEAEGQVTKCSCLNSRLENHFLSYLQATRQCKLCKIVTLKGRFTPHITSESPEYNFKIWQGSDTISAFNSHSNSWGSWGGAVKVYCLLFIILLVFFKLSCLPDNN